MLDSPDSFLIQGLRRSSTERVLEFFMSPELDSHRERILCDDYGPEKGMYCRKVVLEYIGVLGDPGPRLGLLVYSIETLLNLVNWDQVASSLSKESTPP
jgi:hypothetical protein